MRQTGWWLLFLFSTFALSKVFETSRAVTAGLPGASVSMLLLWGMLLLVALVALGYDGYCKAKLEGKLAREVALFEWLHKFDKRGHAHR